MGLSLSCLPCVSDPSHSLENLGETDVQRSKVPAFMTQKAKDIDTFLLPDFLISVENETIPVHKNVLEESCQYFSCMFECGMDEVQTGTLEVKNTSASVVRTMIFYMYGRNISIEWDDVMDYINIIEMWQLKDLKEELEDYIIRNIVVSTDTWINLFIIAQKYHLRNLKRKLHPLFDAPTKLQTCIDTILENQMTMEQSVDLFHRVELTKCSRKFMESVITKYKYTLTVGKRRQVEPYMPVLSQKCSRKNLGMDRDLHSVSEELMDEYFDGGSDNSIHHREDSGNGHTVIAMGNILGRQDETVIVRLNINAELSEISVKEVGAHPWIFSADSSNGEHCLTPYGSFSCGSLTFSQHRACVLLDLPSLNYICLPDIPDIPARVVNCLCVNNTLYVIYDCTHPRPRMMYLNLSKPTKWKHCAPIPQPMPKVFCFNYYACVIGTKIYVILCQRGGVFNNFLSNDLLFYYDTTNNTWSYLSHSPWISPYPLLDGKVVAVDSDMLILNVSCRGCEKYSTVNGECTTMPFHSSVALRPSDSLFYLDSTLVVYYNGEDEKILDCYHVSGTSITLMRSLRIPLLMDCKYCAVLR